jgi:metal-responsive CopG/Arc/MetJ family transcriptional regulator
MEARMHQQTVSFKGSGYGSNVHGKCICVSIPYHELHLIEEADRLAHLEGVTRSQFFRRCIRREAMKAQEQLGRRHEYGSHLS